MAEREIPTGRLILAMALFLLIGAPMVLYDWYTIDQVLAGILHPAQMVIAFAIACVFLICTVVLGRYIRNLVPSEPSPDTRR